MPRVRSSLRALVLAAAGLSAVSGSASDVSAAPAPCTGASAEQAFQTFLTAFNRGDQRALRQAVAPASQFQWYSVGGPDGRYTMQQAARYSTLFAYFQERHRRHERMQQTQFRWYGLEQGLRPGGVLFGGIAFTVRRQAVGIPATYVSGKGSVTCTAPNRLAVWSLANTTLPGMGALDPAPIGP
jgi:hypothetical protein